MGKKFVLPGVFVIGMLILSSVLLFSDLVLHPSVSAVAGTPATLASQPVTDTSLPTGTTTSTATATATMSTATSTATQTLVPTVPSPPVAGIKNLSGVECYNGPSDDYSLAVIMPANTQVNVLGKNSDGGEWVMIEGGVEKSRCWVRDNELNYEFSLDSIAEISSAVTKFPSVCRTGPRTDYKEQTYIPRGRRIVIMGKNNSHATWLQVTPHDSTTPCWVSTILFFINRDIVAKVQIVETPPLPTPVVVRATSANGGGGDGGGGSNSTPDPTAVNTKIVPTPTLCWPPGHCK